MPVSSAMTPKTRLIQPHVVMSKAYDVVDPGDEHLVVRDEGDPLEDLEAGADRQHHAREHGHARCPPGPARVRGLVVRLTAHGRGSRSSDGVAVTLDAPRSRHRSLRQRRKAGSAECSPRTGERSGSGRRGPRARCRRPRCRGRRRTGTADGTNGCAARAVSSRSPTTPVTMKTSASPRSATGPEPRPDGVGTGTVGHVRDDDELGDRAHQERGQR